MGQKNPLETAGFCLQSRAGSKLLDDRGNNAGAAHEPRLRAVRAFQPASAAFAIDTRLLFNNRGNDAGADGAAAFADREA
uniref:hypothetical protein n=1 Tax=uncultured Rhizobium sp. TaxID=155567 RepID=UPI00261D3B5B